MLLYVGMEDDSDFLFIFFRDDFNDETVFINFYDVFISGDKDYLNKIKFKCEKCYFFFDGLEYWQEYQVVYVMNFGLFGSISINSVFGVLQFMVVVQ